MYWIGTWFVEDSFGALKVISGEGRVQKSKIFAFRHYPSPLVKVHNKPNRDEHENVSESNLPSTIFAADY
ncbi:hypothetical protein NECAME_06744 [Necator americanus]|uniref:Uncharacterized protein n=1 Tax=Necator americanus TaxID=51031 RepID=W2TSS3_NECAM|nr:hypothetical protein NECAME_06744 [Necator americanus]ETN84714.1 hypothetical protein NECAME_06744 [Necator americanus]